MKRLLRYLIQAPCRLHATLLLALLHVSSYTQAEATLNIGDPAPGLQPMAWIKGAPLATSGPGRVRVVLFFASWCGASRQALSELSELARLHADEVDFVGVNVREAERAEPTAEALGRFVEARGHLLDFAVAMDDPVAAPLFQQWMRAAGTYPTPTAFIVDREGAIAYMGFPIDATASYLFEDALRDTLADRLDLDAARLLQSEIRTVVMEYLEVRRVMRPVEVARERGDYPAVLAAIEEVLRVRPDYAERVFFARLDALLHVDEQAALGLAHEAYLDAVGGDVDDALVAARIGSLGRILAQADGLSSTAYERAEAYLRESVRHQGDSYGALLDWLALAGLHRDRQRYREAQEAQERALALARNTRELSAEALVSIERQLTQDRKRAVQESSATESEDSPGR